MKRSVKNIVDDHPASDPAIQCRWLIRRDMPEIIEIERRSFEFPWTEEEFLACLRQRNCIGMVAETRKGSEVVGHMIYELHKSMLRILNLAVSPECRRSGVGSAFIGRLIDKLSQQRRREIVAEVRETNLDAQLFLFALGFRATAVLRNHYDECGESAYLMRYRIDGFKADEWMPANRIKNYGG